MSNGMYLQWGQVSIGANSTGGFSFPTTFPNSCASIVAMHGAFGVWQNYGVYVTGPGGGYPANTSTFYISNLDDTTGTYYWMATGW